MREIKFRAWNTVIGWWASKEPMTLNQLMLNNSTGISEKGLDEDFTFMQFTGLTDKNGVEIYDGDLIKNNHGRTSKVVWNKFMASFDSEFVSDDGSAPVFQDKSVGFHNADWKRQVEVIGSIYENPELLREQK